jgi:hypothetical protein
VRPAARRVRSRKSSAYMGQAMAGPDDAHVVSDARGEWRVEVIRAQFMLAVRVEVDRMCPLHGSAIG